jgi:hypothetical protein
MCTYFFWGASSPLCVEWIKCKVVQCDVKHNFYNGWCNSLLTNKYSTTCFGHTIWPSSGWLSRKLSVFYLYMHCQSGGGGLRSHGGGLVFKVEYGGGACAYRYVYLYLFLCCKYTRFIYITGLVYRLRVNICLAIAARLSIYSLLLHYSDYSVIRIEKKPRLLCMSYETHKNALWIKCNCFCMLKHFVYIATTL